MLIGASWCTLVRNDDDYYLQWLFAPNHKILWAGGCHTFHIETPYQEKFVFFLPTTEVSVSLAGITKTLHQSLWVLLEARRGFGSPQRAKNIVSGLPGQMPSCRPVQLKLRRYMTSPSAFSAWKCQQTRAGWGQATFQGLVRCNEASTKGKASWRGTDVRAGWQGSQVLRTSRYVGCL